MPSSSVLQLSGLRTLATMWSKHIAPHSHTASHAFTLAHTCVAPVRPVLILCPCGAVVLGHFVAEPRGLSSRFLSRGHVAVSLYIVLSGFVTHLAYSRKAFSTLGAAGNFYVRRFGRIWLTCQQM